MNNPLTQPLTEVRDYLKTLLDLPPDEAIDSLTNNGELLENIASNALRKAKRKPAKQKNPFKPTHAAVVPPLEMTQIDVLLASHPDREAADRLRAVLAVRCGAYESAKYRKEYATYHECADQLCAADGECEIDKEAPISLSESDGKEIGAYVQAWVWVDKEEIQK